MRVLVAVSVRQTPEILTLFLRALNSLDHAGHDLEFFFIDDNESPESARLLASFAAEAPAVRLVVDPPAGRASELGPQMGGFGGPQKDERTHYWPEKSVWRVAAAKELALDTARERGTDSVLLVDSDLVLAPHTLRHLASLTLPIVSEVFWTAWQPGTRELPNVWVSDVYNLTPSGRGEALSPEEHARRTEGFLSMLRRPGVYRVGGLGACTLIGRAALRQPISFAAIPNLSFWGEDRHFSIRAAALGLPLFADTQATPFHVYRDSDLPAALEFFASFEPHQAPV